MKCIGLPETLNWKKPLPKSINLPTVTTPTLFFAFRAHLLTLHFVFRYHRLMLPFRIIPRHLASDWFSLLALGYGDWTQRQQQCHSQSFDSGRVG